MQELINELVNKAGLSEASAKQSVDVTKEFIKSKLPEGFQDKVDDLLEGKLDMMSILSSFMGGGNSDNTKADNDNASPLDMLKGMFGQ